MSDQSFGDEPAIDDPSIPTGELPDADTGSDAHAADVAPPVHNPAQSADPDLGDGPAIDQAMSDEVLLAAAGADLHDENDMVPPNSDSDVGDSEQAGAAPPGPSPFGFGHEEGRFGAASAPHPGPGPRYDAHPPVRRVYRSRHDRRIGGVSAGIAEYFRIDPTLVRLATILTAVTGIGVLVYFAAWFIIPLRPEGFVEPPRTTSPASERTMTVGFGIATLAIAIGIATGSWAVLAVALIAGGLWLLSEQTTTSPVVATAGPSYYQDVNQAPYDQTRRYEPGYGAWDAASYSSPPPPNAPPPPVHKPQTITWTVLSLLALLIGVGLAASTGEWWDVSAVRFLGVGVVIIAIGVVIGQIRRGGARGLIPLGILAALALFPVSAVDGLLDEGVGEARYQPATLSELESSYQHGIGQLVVDLSEIDFEGRNERVDIELGIGELIVIVSEDTGGQAVLQATAGEISHMLPRTDSVLFEEGVNIETGTVLLQGKNGSLDLNIDVGLGTAELRSEP